MEPESKHVLPRPLEVRTDLPQISRPETRPLSGGCPVALREDGAEDTQTFQHLGSRLRSGPLVSRQLRDFRLGRAQFAEKFGPLF